MRYQDFHRLLEAGFAGGGRTVFARSVTNPLECDAVILDEVSMVDITLMQALINARSADVGSRTRRTQKRRST